VNVGHDRDGSWTLPCLRWAVHFRAANSLARIMAPQ
jgi:hypothetical protein